MDAPAGIRPKANLSDFLAAERTFVAWIRTGLAVCARLREPASSI